jgi:regulatory protein YycH of two-component signal transduction system YycFG
MIERLKTYLLILLVLSSILLTYQIWTYQPHYDYLNPDKYVAHEGISQKKDLKELIQSEKIVFHFGEDKHTMIYPGDFQYRFIKDQMTNWYFYGFSEIKPNEYKSWQTLINQYKGIEISFPTGLPFQLVKGVFQIQSEEAVLPLVNRIWIYQDEASQDIYAMFISEAEQRMVKARASISIGELMNYLSLGESQPLYEAVVLSSPRQNEVYPIHYLSTQPTEVTEFRYFYKRIPIEDMISYLFLDSTLVRPIEERGGRILYTDGTRGLQYDQRQLYMYYYHPTASYGQTDEEVDTEVQRSIQFVNQHNGFDTEYYLYSIHEPKYEQKFTVQFRRYQGKFPIFSDSTEQDQNVIQLEVQSDKTIGYARPLIARDRVIDQSKRSLPAGTEVIAALRESEIPLSSISNITIGYRSVIKESYLDYIPYWVIDLKNGKRFFVQGIKDVPKEGLNGELEQN